VAATIFRHIRDAVLHDLVASPWPVGYGLLDGKETLLRAPVAFYLPAALVGKVLGLATAHVAMGIWTATGATLFLLQVLSLTPSRLRVALTVSAVVVLFSGLDIIGSLLNDGPHFRYDWNITTHIEWWAGKFQYSSMTTQLFWVPNHALGGWLTIGLLCRHPRSTQLNLLLPIIVVAAALWSPLSALGLVPFVLWRVAADSWRERSWRWVNPMVWAPAAALGLVISAYLVLDPGRLAKGVAVGNPDDLVMDLLQQTQFFLLEAGLIGAALLMLRRSSQVALALVILALLPLVYLGPANDLVMRASIPSLAILTIASCLALIEPAADKRHFRYKAALAGLLVLGAVTPVEEIAQQRRAAALDGLGPDLLQLDHVVGDQAVAARDELECQLALADRGIPGDQHPDLEHVEEHAVQRGHLAQLLLHEGPEHVDHVLARLLRGEQRRARLLRRLREDRGRLQGVAHDHAHGVAAADARRRLLARGGLEALEVIDLAPPHDLRQQRMDEVQVPDEPDAGLVQGLAAELAVPAGRARRPREPEALAPRLKQPLYAEPGHRATTR
jgi:hypothetical protein